MGRFDKLGGRGGEIGGRDGGGGGWVLFMNKRGQGRGMGGGRGGGRDISIRARKL